LAANALTLALSRGLRALRLNPWCIADVSGHGNIQGMDSLRTVVSKVIVFDLLVRKQKPKGLTSTLARIVSRRASRACADAWA
jgi:hypothetical protein